MSWGMPNPVLTMEQQEGWTPQYGPGSGIIGGGGRGILNNSGGGAPAAPAAAAQTFGDYALDSLHLSANGHLFGEKRVLSGDPNNPGQSRYDYQTVDLGDASTPEALAAITAATTIPTDMLTQRVAELKVQNAQTQRQGNGSVIGANADGTITYYDRQGNIQTSADMGTLAAQGIQQSDVLQAQTDYQQRARTMANAGQYSAVSANPDGTIAVKDFDGNITNVSAAQASGLPGIAAGEVQYLQQQGNDRNFLGSTVPNYGAMFGAPNPAYGGYSALSGQTQQQSAYGQTPTPGGGAQSSPSSGGDTAGGGRYMSALGSSGSGNQPSGGSTPNPTPAQQANYANYSTPGGGGTSGAQSGTATYGTAAGGAGGSSGGASPGYGYSASGYSGTQQGLQQQDQGMSNYYQYGQDAFNIAHQAQDQQNTAYRYNQTQVSDTNAGQSRNLSGLGWSGITKPVIAGTT